MSLQVRIYSEDIWYERGETKVSGSAFFEDTSQYLGAEQMCSKLQSCRSVSEIQEFDDQISGFYSFIHRLENKVVASVDHIRSIPLYYSASGDIIADNPREISGGIDPTNFDPVLEAEYLLTGYVTGKETLCPTINTIEAGGILVIDNDGNVETKQNVKYYPRKLDRNDSTIEAKTKENLRQAIVQAVDRLCTVAGGRPICVLLSGGYDSKLLLSELVRQEYDSVVAISFGKPGFYDVTESQRIAEQLNVDRKYVEYTEDTWSEWFQSERREKYCKRRHNMDSFPTHWAGPALFELNNRDELPDDAVFASGQTIGSIGEHMPSQNEVQTYNELIDYILDNHYIFWGRDSKLTDQMRDRIDQNCSPLKSNIDIDSTSDLIRMYEYWEWKERQSKWMSQDGSLYSYMGYDWWFPLFDKEVMEAWAKLPVSSREEKSALISVSDETFANVSNTTQETGNPIDSSDDLVKGIKQVVKESPLEDIARAIYKKYKSQQGFGSHPLGYEGMFGPGQPGKYYCGDQSHHSYKVMHAVDRMSFFPPKSSGVPEDCTLSIKKIQQLPRVTKE